MNGRQVADAARSIKPDLRVLFITNYAENAAVGNGHLEPGMELLTKPFALHDLTRKVREMLEPPNGRFTNRMPARTHADHTFRQQPLLNECLELGR